MTGDPPCWSSGDHSYRGTGQCPTCGDRLRCCFCGRFVREDSIDEHLDKVHDLRCPQTDCDGTCPGCLAHEEYVA